MYVLPKPYVSFFSHCHFLEIKIQYSPPIQRQELKKWMFTIAFSIQRIKDSRVNG